MAKKITLMALMFLFSLVVNAKPTNEDKLFFEEIMKNYGFNEYISDPSVLKSKEKLVEVEDKINRLKKISTIHPDEPRIYFAISRLYSIRDEMLKKHLVVKDRMDWFSIPMVQENLQGIRDNLTQVARLLEEGKGKPMQVGGHMSSVISIGLYERFQRLYMKQNPNGLECNDPENHDCLPIPYNEFALDTLIQVAAQYQGYGYFNDADRLLNEIEGLSEAGRVKVAEIRPVYIEARKTWSPKDVEEYSFLKIDGGEPKPITFRGLAVIEEHNKAAMEAFKKEHAKELKETSSSSSSVQQSSSASSASFESVQQVEEIEKRKKGTE